MGGKFGRKQDSSTWDHAYWASLLMIDDSVCLFIYEGMLWGFLATIQNAPDFVLSTGQKCH